MDGGEIRSKLDYIGTIEIVIDRDRKVPKEKWCWQCRRWLEVSGFYKNKYKPDGLSDTCKECDKASRKIRKRKENEREVS